MEPFFFEDSGRSLYGVLHPARPDSPLRSGVVICPPIGQEYMRAHRGLLILANQLARAGYPAMRFDYAGTGDSEGGPSEQSLARWTDNVRAAARELKRRAGVTRVDAVGLRLGAALAFLAALPPGSAWRRLVLWDPVVRGAGYLEEMRRAHREWLAGSFVKEAAGPPIVEPALQSLEILGFEMPATLVREIERLDLIRSPIPPAGGFHLCSSDAEMAARTEPGELRRRIAAEGIPVTSGDHQDARVWTRVKEDVLDQALVPRGLVDAIVARISA
jgi:pimeloyl-ACP methyl ester carboxylesterase